jgi:hypothetical protein
MRSSALFFLVLLFAINGCVSPRRVVTSGGGGGGGGSSNSEFSLSVSPTSQSVTAGAQANYTINVQAQNGFTGTVSFNAFSSDGTITASVNPTSINGGTGSATLTVLTSSSTPASNITVTVNATDPANSTASSKGVILAVQGTAGTAAAHVPAACLNANTGSGLQHDSQQVPAGAHGFTATFDATPSLAGMDGGIGFFAPNAGDQQTFSELIQFSPAGVIQARNGETFSVATNVPYIAGETYHFRLVANLPAVTYSLFVTPPGGTEVLLGANLQLPAAQQGAATVSGLGATVSSPDNATLEVCNIALQ